MAYKSLHQIRVSGCACPILEIGIIIRSHDHDLWVIGCLRLFSRLYPPGYLFAKLQACILDLNVHIRLPAREMDHIQCQASVFSKPKKRTI
ncbi:MAG: hypothetical protein R6V55_11910 [Desulfovermiculus sp.]